MKPIYIQMQAFGSYQEERIDFSNVNHGLFLITGDTGAGKTTIFDAITFALYGKTSGGRRDGRMMRSQYAKRNLVTEVKFQFEYAGDVYTITRTPDQPKYKLDKASGAYVELKTSRPPAVELILPDGTVYPGKIREVDEKIEEIIGLNAEQFTQVAMLAQGDFMKLLLATSKERKEIFARIFDTQIYSRIEWLLKRKLDAAEDSLSENKQEISRELGRVECVKDSLYRETWVTEADCGFFRESGGEDLLHTVGEILREAEVRRSENEQEKQKNQAQMDEVQKKLHAAEGINQLFENLEGRRKELAGLERRSKEICQMQNRVELAQKAQAVELSYQQYLSKEEEKKHGNEKKAALEAELEKRRESSGRLREEAERAQASYEEKYAPLQRKIETVEASLDKYDAHVQAVSGYRKNAGRMQKLSREIEEMEQQSQRRQKELERLEQEIDALRKSGPKAELLTVKLEQLQNRRRDLVEIQKSIQSLSIQDAKLQEQEALCLAAYEHVKKVREEYEKCYHAFLSNQAEILRAELKPGEPCPVCGSVHHVTGQTAQGSEGDMSAEKTDSAAVGRAKKALETAEQKREQVEEEKRRIQGERNVLLATIDAACRKILDGYTKFQAETQVRVAEDLRETEENLKQCRQQKKKAEDDQKLLETDEKARAAGEEEQKAAVEEKERGKEELQECRIKDKEYEASIRALKEYLKYETKAEALRVLDEDRHQAEALKVRSERCSRQYQEEKEKLDRKSGELEQLTRRLAGILEEHGQSRKEYEKALETQGFADTEAFLKARLDQSGIRECQDAVNAYRTSVSVAKEAVRILEEQTKEKQRIDTTELKSAKARWMREQERIEQAGNELFHVISVNRTAYKRGKELYAQREKLRTDHILYKNLSDTANGKLGGKHLNFQTYIQREFFRQVIAKANQRLRTMARGQFLLQCRELKDLKAQGEVGLDLDVYSLIHEQTRDVKTLSGGESFMAALAMALGMADMIQESNGRVHIDTMFIDEGFGSLSEETRSEALAMLGELACGKRLVGIISHVTELKAQVGTKLIVKKGAKGSRTEWEIE